MNNKPELTNIASAQLIKIARSAVIGLVGGIAIIIAAWVIGNCVVPLISVLERI